MHVLLRHGRGAVQHDREPGDALLDLLQDVETEFGRHEHAVRIARALLGLELIGSVRRADRDGQRIHTGLLHEILHVLGTGVGMVFGRNLVLDTGQHTQLALHRHIVLVGILHDLLRQRHVLIVRQVRTVDHHRRETHIDAILAKLEGIAVIQMQHDRNVLAQLLGILHGTLGHVAQNGRIGILAGTRRHLHNHGRRSFDARLHDGLHLLHVIEIESGNGIPTLDRLGKHLAGIHQAQFFIRYHNYIII